MVKGAIIKHFMNDGKVFFHYRMKETETGEVFDGDKLKYMEALHLNERERQVVYEGGYIIGKAEGKAEGIVDVACALLAKGIDVTTISECSTGLSQDQVEALK